MNTFSEHARTLCVKSFLAAGSETPHYTSLVELNNDRAWIIQAIGDHESTPLDFSRIVAAVIRNLNTPVKRCSLSNMREIEGCCAGFLVVFYSDVLPVLMTKLSASGLAVAASVFEVVDTDSTDYTDLVALDPRVAQEVESESPSKFSFIDITAEDPKPSDKDT